jgi:MFS family permease
MIGAVLRLALALFAAQAGFHGFTAALPVALARAGFGDVEIGLVVGTAAVVQMPAAVLAGRAIDRLGGLRLFFAGTAAYVVGALILLAVGVDRATPIAALLAARLVQGIGIAIVIPAALSLVPSLVSRERQGFGLALMGSAHNLTQGVLPPLSLALLASFSMRGVALFVLGSVAVGAALAAGLGKRLVAETAEAIAGAGGRAGSTARRFGFVYNGTWSVPLLLALLFAAHWGVVVAYLPQRAEAAGADVGLFFAADALAIFASRVPTGWVADRVPANRLIVVGIAVTIAALALLLPQPTTTALVIAGIGTGLGGGLVVSPLLLEFARRSGPSDRGSAFALFSVAFAAALSLGSIGSAPVVALGGFEPALILGMGALVAAGVVAALDRTLRVRASAAAHHGPLAGPAVDGPGMVELPPG